MMVIEAFQKAVELAVGMVELTIILTQMKLVFLKQQG